MDLALNNLQRLICHKTQPSSRPTKQPTNQPAEIFNQSDVRSSSCHGSSTNIPDLLSPLHPIVHRFWQVLSATSRIDTELLYVGSNWSPCFYSTMCACLNYRTIYLIFIVKFQCYDPYVFLQLIHD